MMTQTQPQQQAGPICWGEGNVNGTSLRGYLDGLPYTFEETVARLATLSGQDPAQDGADKISVEFVGTFHGQPFTLYDYKGDMAVHIGGSRSLNVEWLKTALWEALATTVPTPYTATVPEEYGGATHGWQQRG